MSRELIADYEGTASVRAKLNAILQPYASRALFEAAMVPPEITELRVNEGQTQYRLTRSQDGAWVDATGSAWDATPLIGIPRADFVLTSALRVTDDRYAIRKLGLSPGNALQSFAVDEVGRHVLLLHEASASTLGVLSRVRLDGPVTQAGLDAMAASNLIGHQGLTVEYPADGSVKIICTYRPNSCAAMRFDYVPNGAPGNPQVAVFWDPEIYSGYSMPTISSDQRWLVVRAKSGSRIHIKVFALADVVWGSVAYPSDMTTARPAFAWSFAEAGYIDSNYPYQGHAASSDTLVTIAGYGYPGFPPRVRQFDLFTGRDLSGVISWPGSAWPDAVAANEPEGFCYTHDAQTGALQLLVGLSTGPTAQRISRIMTIGHRYRDDADLWLGRVQAALPADSRGTSAQRSALREFRRALLMDGLDRYIGALYVLAAPNPDYARLDLADPGYRTLEQVGGGTWDVAANGVIWRGDGVSGFFRIGPTWANLPHYHRMVAWAGAYLPDPGVSGGVIGTETGSYTFLQPRSAANAWSSRLNHAATANQIAGMTDVSGFSSLVRADDAGYTARLRGDDLAYFAGPTASLATSSVCIGRSPTTYAAGRIGAVVLGYPPTPALEAAFVRHLRDYIDTIGIAAS